MTNQNASVTIYTDGGARGNPGPAAAAFVVLGKDKKIVYQKGIFLGKSTNNFAEYSAVIFALEWLSEKVSPEKKENIIFKIDSLLVVNQLNGLFKIKNKELRSLILKIKLLESSHKFLVSYQHVLREQNFLADHLVNETLDQLLSSH